MIEIYLSFLSGYLNFWDYYVVIVKNFLYIIKCKISFVKFFKFGYKWEIYFKKFKDIVMWMLLVVWW